MPGMNTGLSINNPAIVSAFQAALLHQGLIVLLILALVAMAWNVQRAAQLRRAQRRRSGPALTTSPTPLRRPEPAGRRLLRVSFGLIWVFDGILQAQISMPLGLAPQVVQPATAGSPGWVQHLVNAGTTVWNYHPVTAAAGSRVGPGRDRALVARRRHAATGRAWPGWPASPGGWWSGCSGNPSGGFSAPG